MRADDARGEGAVAFSGSVPNDTVLDPLRRLLY